MRRPPLPAYTELRTPRCRRDTSHTYKSEGDIFFTDEDS